MTTAVWFDLDGTLVELTKSYETLLSEAFETRTDRADPAWLARYEECFFDHLAAATAEPYRRAMTDVCESFDLSVDPEQLVDTLLDREIAATVATDGTPDLLERLTARPDHSVGVITNGVSSVQRAKMAHTGLGELFETVVASADVGACKPDSRPFTTAKERLDAESHVMIGDSYDSDIVGAHESGFETIHLRTDEETTIENTVADHTIERIAALDSHL